MHIRSATVVTSWVLVSLVWWWFWQADTDAQDGPFRRGDADCDGSTRFFDAVFTLDWLSAGGTPPRCRDAADANDDGRLDLTDAVYTLSHLLLSGPRPPPPFPNCGVDPTEDGLDCRNVSPCPSVALNWAPPVSNEDGTPLTDLAGYKVYYGREARNYTSVIAVGDVTTHTVDLPAPGTYYFAVTACDWAGNESEFSREVSYTLE